MANTTARQMLRMNAFTLPSMATKLSPKAFSVSVLVGAGELRNISSMAEAIEATWSGESAMMPNVPAVSFANETASSTYFQWKYTDWSGMGAV